MHYSSPPPQSFASSKGSWAVESSQTQPPSSRQPGAPRMGAVALPNPCFSETPTSLLRRVLGGPSLHPLLDFDPVGRLRYDLRQPITQIQARMPQYVKLQQLATNPVVCRMTIHIPATSWVLTLQNPQGVTVEHVLTMLYNELQRIVGRGEYLSFPLATQHHASAVYHARSRGNHAEHSQGIKRVDFLCGKCLFLGLTRATDGSDAWVLQVAENP